VQRLVRGNLWAGRATRAELMFFAPPSFLDRGKVRELVQDFLVSVVDFAGVTLISVAILCLLSMW
jgi:hypothetical protein